MASNTFTRRWLLLGAALLAASTFVPTVATAGDKTGTIKGKLDAKKKYRKNAVVYLEGVTTKPPKKPVLIDQKNQKFSPRVTAIVKGTTIEFANSDDTGHNVFSPDGEKYDLGTWGKGDTRKYVFNKLGTYTQLCKLHPSMIAFVVVLPNEYFATSHDDGSFEIRNVPPGTYTLRVWHERGAGGPEKVTVKAGATATVTVKVEKKKK